MSTIVYKEMQEEYLSEVLEIYNHFVLNTTYTFDIDAVTITDIRQSVMYEDPRYKSYVIFDGEIIKGYVLITPYKPKQAYEFTASVTIYLKPDFVGHGIGKQSLQFIEDIARQNGFHVLIATLTSENERSKYMFESQGYTQCAHFREVGYKFGKVLDVFCYQKIFK